MQKDLEIGGRKIFSCIYKAFFTENVTSLLVDLYGNVHKIQKWNLSLKAAY